MNVQTVDVSAIGRRVAKARVLEGLTTAQLAVKADVNPKTVERLEAGKHAPSLETLTAIARALGLRLEWLINGCGQMAERASS